MEIHELNTFSGTPGANDYLATDNGEDTSKIAITSITGPLNDRIDNIIAGPAPSEQEIIDARLGGNGITYPSLGGAIRGQFDELYNDAVAYGAIDYDKYLNTATRTTAGVTFSYNNGVYSASGTATATAINNLISQNPLSDFKIGVPFHIFFESSDPNIYLQVYRYVGGSLISYISEISGDEWVTLPDDTEGVIIRARVRTNTTVDGTFTISVRGALTPNEAESVYNGVFNDLPKKLGYVRVLTSDDDINDLQETGAYVWLASNMPVHVPNDSETSIMTVVHAFRAEGFSLQTVYTINGKMYQRIHGSEGAGWYAWYETSAGSGGGGGIENTYNITTSPTITTDTNGWLQAIDTDTADETGKTDMTGPIMSMLTDTGYCHLGEGIFYISGNIDMPNGSMLCGCGKKTVVRLLQSTTEGYCVKIGKHCTIKDVSFEGAKTFSVPATKGTRNGIAFMANYDASPSVTTDHCMVENVWLKNFSGAGIYCHNTSINYAKGLYVLNAFIYECYAGIDIDYYSEFNKFVNVCTGWCKYGCINNGGNNVFSSCTFHATDTGFLIDGSQPNSAHGTMTGCTFCHIGSNTGKAIDIQDATAGFIINSCQFWYNSIEIKDSNGIVFNSCEMGRGTTGRGATINITRGGTVLFNGCMFMNDLINVPDITITSNTKVKFTNCFGSVSGKEITA